MSNFYICTSIINNNFTQKRYSLLLLSRARKVINHRFISTLSSFGIEEERQEVQQHTVCSMVFVICLCIAFLNPFTTLAVLNFRVEEKINSKIDQFEDFFVLFSTCFVLVTPRIRRQCTNSPRLHNLSVLNAHGKLFTMKRNSSMNSSRGKPYVPVFEREARVKFSS